MTENKLRRRIINNNMIILKNMPFSSGVSYILDSGQQNMAIHRFNFADNNSKFFIFEIYAILRSNPPT